MALKILRLKQKKLSTFIQETKLKQQGKIKTEQCKKYQIFELNRKEKAGGGLAIGAIEEVKPVWISEGDDEVEILVVEIKIIDMKIRCICAYGPKETDCVDKKEKFWGKLTAEVENANLSECAIIIQMDGNLWGGPEVVKNDPNHINNNGKLFKDFLRRNPQLTVGNNLDICEGSITRSRKAGHKVEKSILDFFIFCEKMKPFVSEMIIDESKSYALSSYSKSRGKIHSDHNTMVVKFNLEWSKKDHRGKNTLISKIKNARQTFSKILVTPKNLVSVLIILKVLEDKVNYGSHSYKKVFTNLPRKSDIMEKLKKQKSVNFLMFEEDLCKISRNARMTPKIDWRKTLLQLKVR